MVSVDELNTCEEAVARVQAAAVLAKEKADGAGGFFSTYILGAGSTAEAMRADAAATQRGADVLREKLERWRLDPTVPTHDDVMDFLRAASVFANVTELQASAQLLSVTNAVTTVAGDTAKDVAKVAAVGITGVAVVYVLLAFGLFFKRG